MNVVIAIDSFKGSLTTNQAGSAIENGIKRVFDDAIIKIVPIADGGEGTVNALTQSLGGEIVNVKVNNPLGKIVSSKYGIINKEKLAIIEIAEAAGITLINSDERNPLITTTYGVGELIVDAINKGCRRFIIGIGGSATNDGGIGMLRALGFKFYNNRKEEVINSSELSQISFIDTKKADKRLKNCIFNIACDVKNPLCGKEGCSSVFGPQKGANNEMINILDDGLLHYANVTKTIYPNADKDYPGAGAAGGLGFAFMTFLNGTLISGIDLVIKETKLEEEIKKADIVITGEGRLDSQSVMGKAPIGVAQIAKKYQKKVISFSGAIGDGASACNENGIDAFFSIIRKPCSLEEALNTETAFENLSASAEQVFRLINSFNNKGV